MRSPGIPSLLRAINDRAALELLLERGPLSRTELGRLTGLSKPTASQLLTRLEQANLVVGVGTRDSGRGPNAQLYHINPAAAHVVGVDVTPKHLEAVLSDLTGTSIGRYVLQTPGRSASTVVDQVCLVVNGAISDAGLEHRHVNHVVLGAPGAYNPQTDTLLDVAGRLPGWSHPGLLSKIRAELGIPVDIENDVNLIAMAERSLGTLPDADNFAVLWIAEGVGAALVMGGVLQRGSAGAAGEVGYLPLPGVPLAHTINRSGTGDLQTLAGAPAVVALARAHGVPGRTACEVVSRAVASLRDIGVTNASEAAQSTLASASSAESSPGRDSMQALPSKPTSSRGSVSPEVAKAFLDELASRLTVGLATIVSVVDPSTIVLSGDTAFAGGELLCSMVERELTALTIRKPRLVLGAVTQSPISTGAIQAALAVVREDVFRTVEPGVRTTED